MSRVRFVLALLAALPAQTARGSDSPLRTEVEEIAKQVAGHVREHNEKGVAVGAFTGPDDGHGGPGLGRAFGDAFAKLELAVKADSRFTLGGSITPVKDGPKGTVFVKLLIELKDSRNAAGRKFQGRALRDPADVAVMVGATADLTRPAEALVLLTAAIEKPDAVVAAGRVSASRGSPFGVEVLVKNPRTGQYAARPPSVKDGQAFVDVKEDEVYALRLVNTSGGEVAAYVTIDGIDLFAFAETGGAKASAVITPAGGEGTTVRGWPIDARSSAEFQVAEYGKTAAAQLKASAANVGVVTVRFAPCWPADDAVPPEARGAGPLGTAVGDRFDTKFKPEKRQVGGVRAVVSVRYTR